MLSVGLLSKDQKLASVLSSILGTEFTIVPAANATIAHSIAEKDLLTAWLIVSSHMGQCLRANVALPFGFWFSGAAN